MGWGLLFILPGFIIWSLILCLPYRPWGTRESLDAKVEPDDAARQIDLSTVTVIIPARNEAKVIEATLNSLKEQGKNLSVILVDDQSEDNTPQIAQRQALGHHLTIISGSMPPQGWSGKLWALEQASRQIETDYALLLDADILLSPGLVSALLYKLKSEQLAMVSLMVLLRTENFWEKLLMPAFVYFFKLLYPFRLANSGSRRVAAAAGGCILIRTSVLKSIGGFSALKSALIDDCTLARRVKEDGHRIWIGLTHSAFSQRHHDLFSIWQMITRTAYTQLHHSLLLLSFCSLVMVAAFCLPVMTLILSGIFTQSIALLTLMIMALTYWPTLKYYRSSWLWLFALPLVGGLYLLMTWTSAVLHIIGLGIIYLSAPIT